MILNKLQNRTNKYFSHYTIIKCVDFESIHYDTSLDVTSFFNVLNEFNFVKYITSLNK